MDESEEHDVVTHHEEEIIPVKDDDEEEKTGKEAEKTGKEAEKTGKEAEKTGKEAEKTGKEAEKTGEEAEKTEKTSEVQIMGGEKTEDEDVSLTVESPIKKPKDTTISFTSDDKTIDDTGKEEVISAPKTIARLEEISTKNHEKRKLEEEEEDDEEEKINIGTEIKLDSLDIHDIAKPLTTKPDPVLNDIEILT